MYIVLTEFIKRFTYSALHACVFPQILSYKIFSFFWTDPENRRKWRVFWNATICGLKQASKYCFEEITCIRCHIRSQVHFFFSENNEVVFFLAWCCKWAQMVHLVKRYRIPQKIGSTLILLRKLWTYHLLFSSPFCMKCIGFTTRTYSFKNLYVGLFVWSAKTGVNSSYFCQNISTCPVLCCILTLSASHVEWAYLELL
jgi:hypothetical protein